MDPVATTDLFSNINNQFNGNDAADAATASANQAIADAVAEYNSQMLGAPGEDGSRDMAASLGAQIAAGANGQIDGRTQDILGNLNNYQQRAATNQLLNTYGSSAGVLSGPTQQAISNTAASLANENYNNAYGKATQGWQDANSLAQAIAGNSLDAQTGMAANSMTNAMNKNSFLDDLGGIAGIGGKIIGGIFGG
jgi:hypothetical protein